MTKANKKIRFGLLFAGLVLFCNPYFAVIDVLPDFIGCLLIILGLSRAMLVNRVLAEARTAFVKLMLADIAKTVLLMITLSAGSTEQPTALLLIAFSATVVELFFLIPAMNLLFEGLSSLVTLEDCPALYTAYRGRLSRIELLQRQTLVFIIAREVICLLPEFTALTLSSYTDSRIINLYDHIGLIRAFSVCIVLACALVWLVQLTRTFVALWREKGFFARIEEKYQAYMETHPGIAVERRYAACFSLLFAGVLLFVDFYLDLKNVIPDGVGACLILLAIFALERPWGVLRIAAALLAVAYGAVATLSGKLSYRFLVDFGPSAIDRSEEGANAYLSMWVLALIEFIVFLALLATILLLLRRVIAKHAGYLSSATPTEFDLKARKEYLEEFDASLLRLFVLGFLSGICSFFFDYIQEIPNGIIFRLLEYFWMLDFSLALVFAALFGNLLLHIYKEIQSRYQYD